MSTKQWTNIEDEVLKAAISKYGLNQWSRVSSLLARKSAKNCKARWNEWLSPDIKKTEWSQDEDEKLLHLVKIFPTSWRTVASRVGRTANQCLERYQQLLDQAEKNEAGELGLAGVGGGEAMNAEDVRKLRVGEADPNPEMRPARPDEVDLDESSLEMLSEARARLANTQGKKAKRKARERDLEASRRVASLVKRRELKLSGINIKIKTTKKGEMDYNADIPFERQAAPGFFDTQEEEEQNERQRQAFDPKKQQLANKRKGDPTDDGEDHKRRKNDKSGQSISAAAMKAAQQQRIREAEQSSKRRSLVLPAPQVGEGELEDIVKMGMTGERAARAAGSDNNATRGLVGNYSLASATPIRTPRAAPEEDRIANELRNIRALNDNQSALFGGDNADLIEGSGSTGFAGATPSRHVIATPNPMATPFRQAIGTTTVHATPLRTPRDNLNLNQGGQVIAQTPRDMRLQETANRQNLLSKLAALPKAKALEFELELPDENPDIELSKLSEEDAAVRDAREKKVRDAAELAEFKRQTQVVQKYLPRPTVIDIDAMMKNAKTIPDEFRRAAAVESVLLIANDALKFGGSKVAGASRPVQVFGDEAMQAARKAVALETKNETRKSALLLGLDAYIDEIDEHQLMVETFDNVEEQITEAANKSNELEKKLAKLHGGYQVRAKTLRQKITEAAEALEKTSIALNTSLNAQFAEKAAIPNRLEKLRDEVSLVSRREREAQEEYRKVKQELDDFGVNGVH